MTEELEKKVHETILEVNLGAMIANLNYYRSRLRPDTKMVCMVKASAYGAGSYEIAKTLQEHHVDFLAVAVADEGSELRKAGITASIIIMNPEMTAFKTMFDYKLEPEVYSFHLLDALIKEAEKEGITNFPIHIKLDTGMHRLGFAAEDMPRLIERLKGQNAVIARSVFSHFAHHKDSRVLPFRGKLVVSVALLGIIGVDDALAAKGHGIAGHLLHGYLRVGHAEDLCQLGLRDVVGQRPLRQERTHQWRAVRDGIPQGAVEPPGIKVGVVGIDIEVGEKIGAAGLSAGKPAGGVQVQLQLPRRIQPGHIAGGCTAIRN